MQDKFGDNQYRIDEPLEKFSLTMQIWIERR